jgi:hypothetical protein
MTDPFHELRETCNAFRDGEQRALEALRRARESNQRLSGALHTKTLECGHARVKLLQLARYAQRFLELLETGAPGIVDAKRELNARVGAALSADQPAATETQRELDRLLCPVENDTINHLGLVEPQGAPPCECTADYIDPACADKARAGEAKGAPPTWDPDGGRPINPDPNEQWSEAKGAPQIGDSVIMFGKEGEIVKFSAGREHAKVRHIDGERWYWTENLQPKGAPQKPEGE